MRVVVTLTKVVRMYQQVIKERGAWIGTGAPAQYQSL